MNKQIEALKMAIAEIEGWIDHAYGKTPEECADNKAIKACKEALADAEKQEQSYQHKWDKSGERCVKCGDKDWMGGKCNVADSQEQEPVAWMSKMGSFTAIAETKKQLPKGSEPIPLYTHPATWQSLSDEELDEIAARDIEAYDFSRAIEQALKEKNAPNN